MQKVASYAKSDVPVIIRLSGNHAKSSGFLIFGALKSLGFSVGTANALAPVVCNGAGQHEKERTMETKRYYAMDDSGEEISIGEHGSLDEACEHARLEWETCGCYDTHPRCLVSVEVWCEDAPHEGRTVEIEVGEDEPPPETLCGDGDECHNWTKPYHLLGGCTQNPGVWSIDNRIRETEVCAKCGLYRHWTSASTPGQLPAEPERVEYDEPSEASLVWAARETWLVPRRWKLASIEARSDGYLELEFRMRTGPERDDYVRVEVEVRYADSGPIRPCVRDDHEPLEALDHDELCEFIAELPDFPHLADWFEPNDPGRLRLCEDVCQRAAEGMTTPPGDGGQMVQRSYGYDRRGWFFMCVTDKSDRSEVWYYADAEDCGCDGECDCFSPHICAPEGFDWVRAIPHYTEYEVAK